MGLGDLSEGGKEMVIWSFFLNRAAIVLEVLAIFCSSGITFSYRNLSFP